MIPDNKLFEPSQSVLYIGDGRWWGLYDVGDMKCIEIVLKLLRQSTATIADTMHVILSITPEVILYYYVIAAPLRGQQH